MIKYFFFSQHKTQKLEDTHKTKSENRNRNSDQRNENLTLNIHELKNKLIQVTQNEYVLKLRNKYSNSCYANSVIQCLLSLGYRFFYKVSFFFKYSNFNFENKLINNKHKK